MKKFLVGILTVFIFISCENDDLATKINESNDLYVFRGIEYMLEDNDGIQVVTDEPVLAENNDTVVFCFHPDKLLPYLLRSNEALAIAVPERIVGDEIILSPEIWKYSEKKTFFRKNNLNNNITDPAFTKCSGFMETMCVTYVARFVGIVTGNTVELKGKWKRKCANYTLPEIVVRPTE